MPEHFSNNLINVLGPPRFEISRRNSKQVSDKRGLIVNSSSMFVNAAGVDEVRIQGLGLNPQGLRFALLFWDELAFPGIPMIGPNHGDDEEFLIREGILFRARYVASGSPSILLNEAPGALLNVLEHTEPGVWSIGDGDLAFLGRRGFIAQQAGSGMELFRAIPVPDQDVPLVELLAFKSQRRPELLALRHQIDMYVDELLLKENIQTALNEYVTRIDAACADVLRVFSEWKQPFRISNVKTSFDVRPFVPIMAGIAAFSASQATLHLPLMTAALAGLGSSGAAAAPFFKVAGDIGWIGLRERHSPFRYVKSYHREVFGR